MEFNGFLIISIIKYIIFIMIKNNITIKKVILAVSVVIFFFMIMLLIQINITFFPLRLLFTAVTGFLFPGVFNYVWSSWSDSDIE